MKVLKCDFLSSGYGTTKYRCEWVGEYTPKQLYDYCDGTTGHYGGRIEHLQKLAENHYKGTVCVYYD